MKTVREYCEELGWSISDLARQAGLSWQTAQNAWNRETIQNRTKRDICSALSGALGQKIKPGDVKW